MATTAARDELVSVNSATLEAVGSCAGGEALVTDAGVANVFFTGSLSVGRRSR